MELLFAILNETHSCRLGLEYNRQSGVDKLFSNRAERYRAEEIEQDLSRLSVTTISTFNGSAV